MKRLQLVLFALTCFAVVAQAQTPVLNSSARPVPAAPQLGANSYLLMDFNSERIIVENNAGTRMTIEAGRRVGTICRVNLANQVEKYEDPEKTIYWEIKLAWDIDGVIYESCNWITSENCEWWPWTVDAETVVPGSGRPFVEVPVDELSEDQISGDEMLED